MHEENGYVKLFRKFKKWGWYQDMAVKSVFIHCLLSASYVDFEWMGKKYKSGQFITSLNHMSKDLNISVQMLRTALKKLQSTNEISVISTNKFTLIKVIKWENYQCYDVNANNQTTFNKQTDNNPLTNHQQQYKNKKNKKNNSDDSPSFVSAYPNVPNLADLYKQGLL